MIVSPSRPVTLPEAVTFDLSPRSGGEPYRIFLRVPPGEPPAGGWPILYLLDGNAVFATAVDALRVQSAWPLGTGVHDGVIVGVGYPTDAPYDSVRRSWDLGPPPGATYPPHSDGGPDVRTGGADAFLDFIEQELKPEIARRTSVDASRQAIFGHSFGGLCALHGLFTRTEAFSSWIAVSPTIYWPDTDLLGKAAQFERNKARPAGLRVLISAGEFEQRLAPFQIGAPDEDKRRAAHARSRTVDLAREMAERLSGLDGVDCAFELIGGETHMSVLPTAINQSIRFFFGYSPPTSDRLKPKMT
ncbi:alpha/beta hydrolase-fold protein [Methylopila sp. M107]|uniref:alpha/beta hydrolase n=1 Tax=Methylopila sp. M107 TaxID=1101190 RepID=UPI000368EBB4|nr:alpha/beta hydrolase-fold protein [Methylopila sp. M107]